MTTPNPADISLRDRFVGCLLGAVGMPGARTRTLVPLDS